MNVVVIACNGLQLGFLGAYGNAWIETPNIDRLAAEGVVFDHHFPENLTTLPTRRSWWTGRYGFPDPDRGWTPLDADEPILPDLLADRGVRTAFVSDVPYLREVGHGYGRGFDEVAWIRGSGYDPFIPEGDPRLGGDEPDVESDPAFPLPDDDDEDRDLWLGRWGQVARNRTALGLDAEENAGVSRCVRAAIGILERREPGPFLLWLDLFAPHGPWVVPQPYRDQYAAAEPDEFEAGEEGDLIEDEGEDDDLEEVRILVDVPGGVVGEVIGEAELLRLRRTYAGQITLLDRKIGELYAAIERLGLLGDTLIAFTADQGEPLGEHGYVRRYRPWLYEELIHTPLILRLPGAEAAGTRHRALVQTVDLLPTILSALGQPPADGVHGRDLLPLVRGEAAKLRDYACLGMDGEEYAIRTHHWHLTVPIAPGDPDDPPRSAELFRKPEDRWDQNDVAAQHRDVADALELALRRFADAVARDALDDLPPLREAARYGGAQ